MFLYRNFIPIQETTIFHMHKKDILAAAIIAEIDAWLFIAIFKNLDLNFGTGEFAVLIPELIKFLPLVLPGLAVLGFLIAWLIGRKIVVIFQLYKFLLTGSLNTFIDLGVLNFLMWAFDVAHGWPYSLFKGISFTTSVVNSYFWNKFWTFEKKETGIGAKEFSRFYLLTGVGFLLNVGIASFLVNVLGPQFGLSEKLWANVGAIIATTLVCMWNFLGYKLIVFKK